LFAREPVLIKIGIPTEPILSFGLNFVENR